MPQRIMILAAVIALALSVTLAAAAEPETEAANAAVDYIVSLQNPDGGFPAFGEESAAGSTIDAVFALVAAGLDPLAVTADGNSPADYLESQAAEYAEDPGAAAKLALAVSAMGLDPADFGGVDLLAILDESFDADTGSYGLDLFDEAFYVLALNRAGEPVPAGIALHLEEVQQSDGGWEFLPGDGSDTNTTAVALQAFLAAGDVGIVHPLTPPPGRALDYLHEAQNADGGFGFLPGEDSDPNTTPFVIQALIAAGEDIDVGGPWAPGGVTPLEGLLSFWNPETGAFQFFGEDSAYATYQVVPALMLAPFPSLQTMPDGEAPPASPTPTNSPTPASSPTPTATATISPVATTTPSDETPSALPSVGGGSSGSRASWWVLTALLAGCAGASAVGLAARRSR